MSVQTPNMGLQQPTIGIDSGLTWEQDVNANSSILDVHNHSAGSGIQINPNGMNINLDLKFNDNNATLLRSTRFQIQESPISNALDVGCLYVSGVDLYYNDINGNQIKMTSGGLVNATSSGISSGSASASFVASVLVVNAASNTPADIKVGSVFLGNNSSGSKYLKLSPPAAMAANYGITLPILPASTSFLTIDSSGSMGTKTFLAPTIHQFTSGSGTYTVPTSPAPLYIKVKMAGAGGGGGGGGVSTGLGTAGSNGGNTTLGSSLLVANGGSGGTATVNGASVAGGSGSLGSGPIGVALTGGYGGPPMSAGFGTGNTYLAGGMGGMTPYLCGSGPGGSGSAGTNGVANSGGGGGGGGNSSPTADITFGGGGGSGAWIEAIISFPSSTYSYSIGSGGGGGSAGTSGYIGGTGADGIIIVEEFYQ